MRLSRINHDLPPPTYDETMFRTVNEDLTRCIENYSQESAAIINCNYTQYDPLARSLQLAKMALGSSNSLVDEPATKIGKLVGRILEERPGCYVPDYGNKCCPQAEMHFAEIIPRVRATSAVKRIFPTVLWKENGKVVAISKPTGECTTLVLRHSDALESTPGTLVTINSTLDRGMDSCAVTATRTADVSLINSVTQHRPTVFALPHEDRQGFSGVSPGAHTVVERQVRDILTTECFLSYATLLDTTTDSALAKRA